jgi:DNA polymerase-4
MDAYFASVEQIVDPSLRGKPVIVCGEGRTVVTTASYPARKYGVRTGMTLPEARKLCPGIITVYGDPVKYIDTSLRIHRILLEFTDQVEVFSIDECFLDITHICRHGSSPQEISMKIKERLKEGFGLTCSIGIGPNKLIAKLAAKMKKPDGLMEIRKEEIHNIFSGLPVEELQGIGVGDKLAGKLRSLGIRTAKELGEASINLLTAHFGIWGYHLKRMGRGEDDSPVEKYSECDREKSIGHSHTLPEDTWDLTVIRGYLRMLSEKVGVRLREANLMGRTIDLMVRYSDFNTFIRQHSLKHYIKAGYEIYYTAYKIFEKLLPLKKAVRLLGVSISNLCVDEKQQFLFEHMRRDERLVEAVDGINEKYGEFTVKPSSLIIAEKFGMEERCGMIGRYLLRRGS